MIDKICNECGTRLSEFYNTGMLGCPYCYKAFENQVMTALYKIQGKTFHVGKTPNVSSLEKELMAEYKRLITEKELATIERRFSDIKAITEQIISLSDELKSRGLI